MFELQAVVYKHQHNRAWGPFSRQALSNTCANSQAAMDSFFVLARTHQDDEGKSNQMRVLIAEAFKPRLHKAEL